MNKKLLLAIITVFSLLAGREKVFYSSLKPNSFVTSNLEIGGRFITKWASSPVT
jgi:hypothetical protein